MLSSESLRSYSELCKKRKRKVDKLILALLHDTKHKSSDQNEEEDERDQTSVGKEAEF